MNWNIMHKCTYKVGGISTISLLLKNEKTCIMQDSSNYKTKQYDLLFHLVTSNPSLDSFHVSILVN